MKKKNDYLQLDLAQRTEWVRRFTDFYEHDLPALEAATGYPDAERFERGLELLSYFDCARNFVENCRLHHGWDRRVKRLRHICETVKRQAIASGAYAADVADATAHAIRRGRPAPAQADALAAERNANAIANTHIRSLEALNGGKRRRGRPTRAEAEERAKAEQAEQQAREAEAEARVQAGERTKVEVQPNLFAEVKDEGDGRLLPLRKLSWLLPQEMQHRLDHLRGWRRIAETEGAMTRTLAAGKAAESEIATHATLCADTEKQIRALYDDIDIHLAFLYRRIVVDTQTLSDDDTAQMAEHGLDREGLTELLRPYYEKVNADKESRERLSQAEKRGRTIKSVKKDPAVRRLKNYITHLPTEGVSAEKMERVEAAIAELRSMGENVEAYEAKLQKMKANANANDIDQ